MRADTSLLTRPAAPRRADQPLEPVTAASSPEWAAQASQAAAAVHALGTTVIGLQMDKAVREWLLSQLGRTSGDLRAYKLAQACKRLDQISTHVTKEAAQKKPKISSADAVAITTGVADITGPLGCL